MLKKKPTLQDVARAADVSTATVSRALSDPETVSEKKRAAVLEAVESTGYRINVAARNLRTQRTNTILALLPTIGNLFFSQVLQGMVEVLTPAGKALVLAETNQIRDVGDDVITIFEDNRADGVIVMDGDLSKASLERIQSSSYRSQVIFAGEWSPHRPFPSVRSANEDGARQAVQHLYDLGHRYIAHVTGPVGNMLTFARLNGYVEACNDLGIRQHIINGAFTLQAGTDAAQDMLAMHERPTAVFCSADVVAYGLISGLTGAGVSVPGDVSVVGFDDIEISEHFAPPLTTIRQDRVALGRAAAEVLLRRSASDAATLEDEIVSLPVELVPRASSAKPTQT